MIYRSWKSDDAQSSSFDSETTLEIDERLRLISHVSHRSHFRDSRLSYSKLLPTLHAFTRVLDSHGKSPQHSAHGDQYDTPRSRHRTFRTRRISNLARHTRKRLVPPLLHRSSNPPRPIWLAILRSRYSTTCVPVRTRPASVVVFEEFGFSQVSFPFIYSFAHQPRAHPLHS